MGMISVAILSAISLLSGYLISYCIKTDARIDSSTEPKSPYDHALANAILEREQLKDTLTTLHALKRVETDSVRFRNEIRTIVDEIEEESPEGAYEPNMSIVRPTSDGREYIRSSEDEGIPIQEQADGTISPILESLKMAFVRKKEVSVFWAHESGGNRYWHQTYGELRGYERADGELVYVTVDDVCIDGDKIDIITEGHDIGGEVLYRKGDE